MFDIELRVKLPNDRRNTGTIELIDTTTGLVLHGPRPILGRADRKTAAAKQNPNGVATLPYGDTPTGTYRVPIIHATGPGTPYDAMVYGNTGAIRLEPTGGDAAVAATNGRTGLLIHAGRQPPVPNPPLESHLKPTNGCLRMIESDFRALIDAIGQQAGALPGNLTVTVGPGGAPGGADQGIDDGDPPPQGGRVYP